MSYILKLIERARDAGLVHIDTAEPTAELPDTATHLGIPMDPELADLYRVTNGFNIEHLFVYGARDCQNELIEWNQYSRDMLDDFPILHNVLLCAGFGEQATELAIVPLHADELGRHPVVIVDTNEDVYIKPLASSLNRGMELLIDEEIHYFHENGIDCIPFPYNAVDKIRNDTRLMELIAADAFAPMGGNLALTQEWYDVLTRDDTGGVKT